MGGAIRDGMPSTAGHGGIDGDCPECGDKLTWTGWGWSVHPPGYHQAIRRRLYRAIRRLAAREYFEREKAAQAASCGSVALKWKCGALRGDANEWWVFVAQEMWDDGGLFRDAVLAHFRADLAELVRTVHGIEVNPATFFHKVYDERTASGCNPRPAPLS